jgi:hypothetical protein
MTMPAVTNFYSATNSFRASATIVFFLRRPTLRLCQILKFMGRATRPNDYGRLFMALGQLQGTNATTNIR